MKTTGLHAVETKIRGTRIMTAAAPMVGGTVRSETLEMRAITKAVALDRRTDTVLRKGVTMAAIPMTGIITTIPTAEETGGCRVSPAG